MLTRHSVLSIFSVAMMLPGASLVSAQEYPSKLVRIFTGTAGGGTDFAARLIAQGISKPLGQQVIVENRSTVITVDVVAKAQPDGHTLLVTGGTFWLFPLLQSNPSWDPVRDFSPITLALTSPNLLVVHPSLPVKSVKDLIALAKAKPGELNYAGSTLGSTTHLVTELFKSMAGVNIMGIHYKGTAPSLNALIGGEVQMTFDNAPSLMPHVKSGRLRALAVTSAQPSAVTPGLPTMAASGLPGFQAGSMQGAWAPAKTPATIIRRLNQEIARLLSMSEVKQKALDTGAETVGNSPEEFAALIKADMTVMGKVIKEAGIRAE